MGTEFGANIGEDEVEVLAPVKKTRAKKAVAVATAAPEPELVGATHLSGKRVRIILEENDSIPPTGQFFGANGRSYILRPGEEAEVPVEVINILDTAVMDTPIVDPTTKQVLGYRQRLRFPYRVLARDL